MPTLITDKYKPEQAKPVHEFIEKPKIVPTDFKTAVVDNKINRLDTFNPLCRRFSPKGNLL